MREAEACGNPFLISPLTRKKLIGGVPLGATEEHVKAANWSLFQLATGGKRLGNPNFWNFFLVLLIRNTICNSNYLYENDIMSKPNKQFL